MASFTFTEPNQAALEPWLFVSGSFLEPNVITASGGISISQSEREYQWIVGDGPTDVSANPQIEAGTFDGQELILRGTSDDAMVILHNGRGLQLNGAVSLVDGATIYLIWNGTLWVEIMRNDI